MKMNILTATAAKLGVAPAASAAPAPVVTTPPAPTAAAPGSEETVDVVTVADANAAIVQARAEGAAAEVTRTQAVLASASGKLHAATAAFMLQANPTASADAIIAHLDGLPAPVAPAAAAPAAPEPAAQTPPAPTPPAAPLTVALTETPKMNVPPSAHGGEAEQQPDAKAFWNGLTAQAAVPPLLAGGVPRTGN